MHGRDPSVRGAASWILEDRLNPPPLLPLGRHRRAPRTREKKENPMRPTPLAMVIGYTQGSALRADGQGLWHGRASRNGEPREVSLDAEGIFHDPWEIGALTMFDRETGEAPTGQGSR
jgi:hypothetical protein